jgi:hypothetical protein
LAAQYRAARTVAQRLNLNSRQYEELLSRIDRRAAREERLVQRAEAEQDRLAMERMAELDENLTDVSQIPNFGMLSPTLRMQILGQIRENTRAQEPEANGTRFLDILEMAYGAPERQREFLDINVRGEPITRGEQAQLIRQQQSIRGEIRESISDSETAANLGRVDTAIRRAIGDPDSGAGIRTGRQAGEQDRRDFARLREAVRIRVEREQRLQRRPLTDAELQGAVNAELLQVSIRDRATGRVLETVPQFRAEAEAQSRYPNRETRLTIDVPAATRSEIVAAFRRGRGRNPTDAEISYLYRRSLLRR